MEIKPINVGIPTSQMDFIASRQLNSQWCWAASIKMILNGYGVAITQQQIVNRTYGLNNDGQLPNWPASYNTITKNLNNWSIDNNGQKYLVKATLKTGRPDAIWLINEINSKRPIILAYKTGPKTGHAVVLTGVSFKLNTVNPKVLVIGLALRDPWPNDENIANKGRKTYSGSFANKIDAYWSIRVYKK